MDDEDEANKASFLLSKTTWENDDTIGKSDIDTRLFGPVSDPYSDPDHPDNQDNPDESVADPENFGPYSLGLKTRSNYLVAGSTWPFQTNSGKNEEWLATPAEEGLHEFMLHNVLLSGAEAEMPFEVQVGALHVNPSPVSLVADECQTVSVQSELDMPDVAFGGFGLSAPSIFEDEPITKGDENDIPGTSVKYPISLTMPAGRFAVNLEGESDDDLDLFVLRDANGDGAFTFPLELIAQGATPASQENAIINGIAPAGAYEVWVHGFAVEGEDSVYDLSIDIVSGNSIVVNNAPSSLSAGQAVDVEICADISQIDAETEAASGILGVGPSFAPNLVQMPVSWMREAVVPTIHLPFLGYKFDLEGEEN